ncbi:peroxiredoxin family protein [Halorussus limi]|uniref:Peroxiredoxin family protein n=1 Tax=Halorussus limi TaxID=2938695 RepID=A0A8U0HZG3_9EURY|nr:redoxin domain-containing protein [Halorussus limi]UPV76289.1 peroxiredoxin family protein [Halorussus limi]
MLRLIKGGSGPREEVEAGLVHEFDRERRDLGVSELDFELPNAGAGPDPLRLSDLAADPDTVGRRRTASKTPPDDNAAVVLLFHRDYRCRNCRQQVQEVADRYGEFRERDAAVVSVLPESREKAEKWQKKTHSPFPVVADADKSVAEQYGQPTRLGKLGGLHDLVGRLPETAILDGRGGDLRLFAVHRGDKPADRPSVDDVLAMVDRMLADGE